MHTEKVDLKLQAHARVCDENNEKMTACNIFVLKKIKFDQESDQTSL